MAESTWKKTKINIPIGRVRIYKKKAILTNIYIRNKVLKYLTR